jgi:hypothetical protein
MSPRKMKRGSDGYGTDRKLPNDFEAIKKGLEIF